jgi:hypothetical protein
MTRLPGREYFEKLADPDRLLVVPKDSKKDLRTKILGIAKKHGLDFEKPGELAKASPKTSGSAHSIHIQQDLRITIDDCEQHPDGSLVLKQELRFHPALKHHHRPPTITQTRRQIWLRGPQAKNKAEKLLEDLAKAGITALASHVYRVPNHPEMKQRFAADPWQVMVTFTDHCDAEAVRKKLSNLLEIEKGPGPWLDARVLKPVNHYELAKLFEERVGDQAELSFHGLPLVLTVAAVPTDGAYPGQQAANLAVMHTQQMWNRVEAWDAVAGHTLSPVVVFLVDTGVSTSVEVPLDPDVDSIWVDLSTSDWEVGSAPFPGDTHGTQMASIIGATWDNGDMAGVVGVSDAPITLVSLRCSSLFHMRRALEYAIDHVPAGKTGVVVFGLEVLMHYACTALQPAFLADAARFKEVLTDVTTNPAKNRLLVVFPSGNKDQANPFDPVQIFMPPPPLDLTLTGTVVAGACNLSSARWVDTDFCSRFGDPTLSLLAPGVNIYGAISATPTFTHASGTSFAAAHVGGVAALMRSVRPSKPPDALKSFMTSCCSSSPSTGECGSGVINGDESVRLAIETP